MELTSDLAAVCLTRPDLIVHACQKVGDEFTACVLCADALLTRCGRERVPRCIQLSNAAEAVPACLCPCLCRCTVCKMVHG